MNKEIMFINGSLKKICNTLKFLNCRGLTEREIMERKALVTIRYGYINEKLGKDEKDN